MFTTTEQVMELTGYEVTNATVSMAQNIIEAYIGRDEVNITDGNDLSLLEKATAYQAAYMVNQKDLVFEQVSAQQIMQFGQMMTFKADEPAAPFVAPLAILACKRLSWKRLRSVKTGSIFYRPPVQNTWRTD